MSLNSCGKRNRSKQSKCFCRALQLQRQYLMVLSSGTEIATPLCCMSAAVRTAVFTGADSSKAEPSDAACSAAGARALPAPQLPSSRLKRELSLGERPRGADQCRKQSFDCFHLCQKYALVQLLFMPPNKSIFKLLGQDAAHPHCSEYFNEYRVEREALSICSL